MSNSNQNEDLFKVIIKEDTHLASSKDTPGAFRATLLSDANNQINGQAELIKVEANVCDYPNFPYEYEASHEPVELTEEQREMAAMLGEAVANAFLRVISAAAPHVKHWWQEKAAPSLKRTWQGISEKQNTKSLTRKPPQKELAPGSFSQDLDKAYERYVSDMTSEEAQRDLLDIFILSTCIVAKIRKLVNSRIANEGNPQEYIEGKDIIAKLSTPHFVDTINGILKDNPNLLEEKSPELSVMLGHTLVVDGKYFPIDNNVLQTVFALKS